MAQQWSIHNIPLWHAAYAAGAALLFGDERMYASVISQELGGYNQVLKGFTPDGIWHENSNLYHYYSLEAASNMCVFLHQAMRPEPEIFARILQAALAPVRIAYRDGIISAMNDGWKGTNVYGKAKDMRWLAKPLEGVPEANQLLAYIREYGSKPCIQTLLYDVPKPKADEAAKPVASVLYAHNRVAVLRSPVTEVYVKFGNLTSSHAHPDALSVSFNGFSMDTGTPGYASRLHREWFTKTLAHNTFIVDTKNMNHLAKGEAILSEDGGKLTVTVADAYEGVRAVRELTLNGTELSDHLTTEASEEHDIDWIFHVLGDMKLDGETEPAVIPYSGDDNGYAYLSDARRFKGSLFKATWTLDGETLTLKTDAGDGEIFLARTPDNPATRKRTTILIRKRGESVGFEANFSFGK